MMRIQVPEVVAPIHIAHPLRRAPDLVTARCFAVVAATRAVTVHADVAVHHIIVPDDTTREVTFQIVSAEGPPALLDCASREIASTMRAEVVVAASRANGGDPRIELFDSSGHSEIVVVKPFAPCIDWLVGAGVTKIPAGARAGYPTAAAAIEYLVGEIKAAAGRGELDIEAHVVAPMGAEYGIVSIIGPGYFDWPPLIVLPARAAARATTASAVVWGLPANDYDGPGSIEVEYADDRVEQLHLDGSHAQFVPGDNGGWWALPGNVERAKAQGADWLTDV